MSVWETLGVAWEGVRLNRIRSFLTTLGVIIGVASVILMLAVSAGAEAEIAEQINALGANLVLVNPMRGQPGAARNFVYEDAVAIADYVSGIEGVSAEQFTTQSVMGRERLEDIALLGVDAPFPGVRDYAVAEGRFFTAEENERKQRVAVLGHGIARDLYGEESPLGETLTIGAMRFTVIGVMEAKGLVGDVDYDGRVYIPVAVLLQSYMPSQQGRERIRTVYVKVAADEDLDRIIQRITTLLAEKHEVDPARPDFSVQTQQHIISTQEATTATFRNLLAWVAGVSLIVGGIGIMNIMLVSVTERTREIGLRQAIGANPDDVRLQFLLEAVILSLVGGGLGVLGGVGGAELMNRLGTIRTALVPSSVPLAFGAAAAVGIFFGTYPANRAAQLDPVEALRHM